MFTTIITIRNPDTDIHDTSGYEQFFATVVPDDVIKELDYLRMDMILDGHASAKSYTAFDNISKTHRYVFYHETAEDMKYMNEAYTTNWAAIELQAILADKGWTFNISHGGTAVDTRDANKITEVTRASLNMVRPSRRQEVFDSLEENNG